MNIILIISVIGLLNSIKIINYDIISSIYAFNGIIIFYTNNSFILKWKLIPLSRFLVIELPLLYEIHHSDVLYFLPRANYL